MEKDLSPGSSDAVRYREKEKETSFVLFLFFLHLTAPLEPNISYYSIATLGRREQISN